MYFEYKNVSEVIELLTNYKNETEAKIDGWRQVEIKKKKSGEEYAKISQAVVNAKFGQYYPVEDYSHPHLTIAFKCGYKWMADNVEAYYYVDELPVEERNRTVVYGGGCMRVTSPMNAEELRKAISEHIDKLEKYKCNLEKQIANAPIMFDRYRTAVGKAEKELEEMDKELRENPRFSTSLYYAIKSIK